MRRARSESCFGDIDRAYLADEVVYVLGRIAVVLRKSVGGFALEGGEQSLAIELLLLRQLDGAGCV